MSETVNVQYAGFQAKALVREYSFLVRQASNEPREFTLTIENEAFNSRRVRNPASNILSLLAFGFPGAGAILARVADNRRRSRRSQMPERKSGNGHESHRR
jgi:hypothetical protein